MDNVSSINALDPLHAYYKVALKTFTNNFVWQVVNRYLLREAADWEDAKVPYSCSGAYERHEPTGATRGQEGKSC
jgi:hypothetical protein